VEDVVTKEMCEKSHEQVEFMMQQNEKAHEEIHEQMRGCIQGISELAKATNGKLERVHSRIDDLTTVMNDRMHSANTYIISTLVGIVLTLLTAGGGLVYNAVVKNKADIELNSKISSIHEQLATQDIKRNSNYKTIINYAEREAKKRK